MAKQVKYKQLGVTPSALSKLITRLEQALSVKLFERIGWLVPKKLKLEGMGIRDGVFYAYANTMMRYVIPPILVIALILGLMER